MRYLENFDRSGGDLLLFLFERKYMSIGVKSHGREGSDLPVLHKDDQALS